MMHSETTLLLCTLSSVGFASTRSVTSTDRKDELTVRDDDVSVTVSSTTTYSVTLKIEFSGWSLNQTLVSTTVITRPRVPADLRWDSAAGHFVISSEIVAIREAYLYYWLLETKITEPRFTPMLYLIRPGTEYEFEIRNMFVGGTVKTIHMVVPTRPSVWRAPKTGAGCFHVYDAGELMRTVEVYWKPEQIAAQYEVLVHEDTGAWSQVVHQGTGPLDASYLRMKISYKSHRFIFTSLSEADRSPDSSVVYVPAQRNVLPALATNARKNKDKGTIVLRWEAPTSGSVSNYTVFWLDIQDDDKKGGLRVRDYVHVGGHENPFEVNEVEGRVRLGISVNTETGSSGMQIAW